MLIRQGHLKRFTPEAMLINEIKLFHNIFIGNNTRKTRPAILADCVRCYVNEIKLFHNIFIGNNTRKTRPAILADCVRCYVNEIKLFHNFFIGNNTRKTRPVILADYVRRYVNETIHVYTHIISEAMFERLLKLHLLMAGAT